MERHILLWWFLRRRQRLWHPQTAKVVVSDLKITAAVATPTPLVVLLLPSLRISPLLRATTRGSPPSPVTLKSDTVTRWMTGLTGASVIVGKLSVVYLRVCERECGSVSFSACICVCVAQRLNARKDVTPVWFAFLPCLLQHGQHIDSASERVQVREQQVLLRRCCSRRLALRLVGVVRVARSIVEYCLSE